MFPSSNPLLKAEKEEVNIMIINFNIKGTIRIRNKKKNIKKRHTFFINFIKYIVNILYSLKKGVKLRLG